MEVEVDLKVPASRCIQNDRVALALVTYRSEVWQLVALRVFNVVQQTACRRYGQREIIAAKSTEVSGLKVLIQLGTGAVFVELPGRKASDRHAVG
jgi:hypothetical protein